MVLTDYGNLHITDKVNYDRKNLYKIERVDNRGIIGKG